MNQWADFRIDVADAAARLEPCHRQMVGLWLAGYTQTEIADVMGVRQGTVSKQIKASFCQLGQMLAYVE